MAIEKLTENYLKDVDKHLISDIKKKLKNDRDVVHTHF
jgi:hypothetical protein